MWIDRGAMRGDTKRSCDIHWTRGDATHALNPCETKLLHGDGRERQLSLLPHTPHAIYRCARRQFPYICMWLAQSSMRLSNHFYPLNNTYASRAIEAIVQMNWKSVNSFLIIFLFSELLPDAIQSDCSKCSDSQKRNSRKVITFLRTKRPQDWKKLTDKYDPHGRFKARVDAGLI